MVAGRHDCRRVPTTAMTATSAATDSTTMRSRDEHVDVPVPTAAAAAAVADAAVDAVGAVDAAVDAVVDAVVAGGDCDAGDVPSRVRRSCGFALQAIAAAKIETPTTHHEIPGK